MYYATRGSAEANLPDKTRERKQVREGKKIVITEDFILSNSFQNVIYKIDIEL